MQPGENGRFLELQLLGSAAWGFEAATQHAGRVRRAGEKAQPLDPRVGGILRAETFARRCVLRCEVTRSGQVEREPFS